MLNEKAQLPPLGNDPASYRWKETQKNTNKQSVHSQVSAMNAATAQMVTLTGHGDDTDHTSVGAAVKTISNNLPEMAKGIQMLAALMDDEGISLFFFNFSCRFLNPNYFFSNLNYNCLNVLDLRHLLTGKS